MQELAHIGFSSLFVDFPVPGESHRTCFRGGFMRQNRREAFVAEKKAVHLLLLRSSVKTVPETDICFTARKTRSFIHSFIRRYVPMPIHSLPILSFGAGGSFIYSVARFAHPDSIQARVARVRPAPTCS